MKPKRALALSFLILTAPIMAGSHEDWPDTYAITGATLFDGTGKPSIDDAVILISKDRVVSVGPKDAVKIPPRVKVIDAHGKWIVPGLIDTHMHFFQSAGLYARPDMLDRRKQRAYVDEIAWLKTRIPVTMNGYICSGVTSVVDMGGSYWTLSLKDRFLKDNAAPRVRASGPLLSTLVPEELRIDDPSNIAIGEKENARRTVRKVLSRGADFIKIWLIDNFGSTEQSVQMAIDEAHKKGVRVAVHATELSLAKLAVKLGADILVHSVYDKVLDDEFLKQLKEKNIIYTPTLNVDDGYRKVLYKQVNLTKLEKKCGDPQVIATWSELKEPLTKPFGDDPRVAQENLRRVSKAGIKIAAGSDAGNIGSMHGPSLHQELELMVKAGLSPQSVLLAATRDAALVTDQKPQVGTLEKGKFADLLILNGDPLKDIRNLAKINTVVKGGRPASRAALYIEAGN